jgi:hypothetical protein
MGEEIRSKPLNNPSKVMEGIRRDLIKPAYENFRAQSALY